MKTTVVGSYPVPDWLKTHPQEPTLIDAMSLAMRAQERAGVDVISDGELGRWDLRRNAPGGMVERFIRSMKGVEVELTREQREIYEAREETSYRAAPPGVVTSSLDEGLLDLGLEWKRASRLTDQQLKFTVTSPYMLAKVVLDGYYHDLEKLTFAFADVLSQQIADINAAVVQVDEPNLPGTPQDGVLAAEAISRVLDRVQCEKAVHLCFGNFGGQTIQQGDYRQLLDFMNRLRCDHLVLETTRRPSSELKMLCEVKQEIRFGVGVIDVKDLQIETPDIVARRIESMASTLTSERLAYVHPDCGLSLLPRPIADGKLHALVAGYKLYKRGGGN